MSKFKVRNERQRRIVAWHAHGGVQPRPGGSSLFDARRTPGEQAGTHSTGALTHRRQTVVTLKLITQPQALSDSRFAMSNSSRRLFFIPMG